MNTILLPFHLCDPLIMACVIASLVVCVSGARLHRHRTLLDYKYKSACKRLEEQQHELDLDAKWLERKAKELERREDRMLKREREIDFLK